MIVKISDKRMKNFVIHKGPYKCQVIFLAVICIYEKGMEASKRGRFRLA